MCPDPNPNELVPVFDGERSMTKPHSRGPKRCNLLEVQRWVRRIALEELESTVGSQPDFRRQLTISSPKAFGRSVDLRQSKFLEGSLSSLFPRFIHQEVQPSSIRVSRNSSLPDIVLVRREPQRKALQFRLAQRLYVSFDPLDTIGHDMSIRRVGATRRLTAPNHRSDILLSTCLP